MPLPKPNEGESQDEFISRCMGDETANADFPENEQRAAVCYRQWREGKATDNALKAVSSTNDELRVANYIVLFGGRDLEGVGSSHVNADGTRGESFAPDVDMESAYTKSGIIFVDWEHGQDDDGPGGESIGVVDWKTVNRDDRGVWVERVLNRRSQYVKWLEQLIEKGLVGSSSESVPEETQKADDGTILRWPLRRDTLTVQPMEPRMITQNYLQAFKALGIPVPDDTADEPETEPEAAPEVEHESVSAAAVARAKVQLLNIRLSLLED